MMAVGGSANTGTWLNAQKALELKFVDEIMFDTEGQLVACASSAAILPPEAINKLRNLLTQQRLDNQIALERASLDLLKLKYKKEVM
jgi:enoyl-CoA hydratase/carnithine racemase